MRRIRKKFKKPKVTWNKNKIKEERDLLNEYGLRRKKEILRAQQILRGYRQRARDLIAVKDREKEKVLIEKMASLGILLKKESTLDDILALNIRNIFDRRLQTIVLRRGFAKTPMQARQLITHGHISVDGRRTKIPSHIIPVDKERKISLYGAGKQAGKEKRE